MSDADADVLARGAARLTAAGVEDPMGEVRKLWRAAAARQYDETDAATRRGQAAAFEQLITRRAAREPISHLLGYRDFYKHRFAIDARALDPRPDTETLVEAALAQPFSRVLDLGTGSGCILLSLLAACPEARGVGTDISPEALELALENRAALELETRAELIQSDWFETVRGRFDLIVSNPPYIAAAEMADLAPELGFEPRNALTDEGDGLRAYRAITSGAGAHLSPGGRLMVEIGWTQAKDVREMFETGGFGAVRVWPDIDGRDRVVSGVWLN